jgi:hypothetical protein
MKALLRLEAIGEGYREEYRRTGRARGAAALRTVALDRKPEVAEVSQSRPGERRLTRLRPDRDYARASSTANRGLYWLFVIESGHLYQVRELVTWNHERTYFCTVSAQGEIVEVPEGQIDAVLREQRNRRLGLA